MSNAVLDNATQVLLDVWQQHTYYEFVLKDARGALETMSDNPHVLMVPIAIGGRGRQGVYHYYHDSFLVQLPDDMMSVPISQAIGKEILVEESVYTFTHDLPMDWMIPGVPATGRRVEVGVLSVIQFKGDKIASEHLYWDHASILAQLGVIDPAKYPIKGAESARTLLSWAGITP